VNKPSVRVNVQLLLFSDRVISGIRDYIVSLIIKIASDENAFLSQKVYLNKLNLVLVQVRRQNCLIPELMR
jgi:hypothetical protein